MEEIEIYSDNIKLDQFLKWANIVETGGEAKLLIQSEKIKVNNQIETRRSHKIKEGDLVTRTDTNKSYKVIKT
ncbi:MAG: RNA-binding S4 domain-containing protein [bacterium]